MPLISITKTYRKPCKPPTGGGEPPVVAPPIYIPIVPDKPPYVDNTLPGDLPRPSHPIWIPIGETPEVPGVPSHPIYLPPVYPSHPIVIPPEPPVDGGPPVPTHPIVIPPDAIVPVPPTPEHPIWWPVDPGYFPPGIVAPPEGGTKPEPPLVIWGPPGPWPTPPIYIPIEPPPPVEGGPPVPTHPIYIPVFPDNSLPEIEEPVDPGYFPPGVGGPGSGLTPENPIVLPPDLIPPGTTTIYVSLTPGVPIEVNIPATESRRKK